ncbi:MAG: hypothetical protein DHS20C19_18200 [Acidimicrobiales bacterium]|nr:MAG: hypothetical protein DHS20C19_18200 [Acidimicrobiales bacterium]
MVHGAERDLGTVRHRPHLHAVVAALGRQLDGGLHDAPPPFGLLLRERSHLGHLAIVVGRSWREWVRDAALA